VAILAGAGNYRDAVACAAADNGEARFHECQSRANDWIVKREFMMVKTTRKIVWRYQISEKMIRQHDNRGRALESQYWAEWSIVRMQWLDHRIG
jgi:hypothetical protein